MSDRLMPRGFTKMAEVIENTVIENGVVVGSMHNVINDELEATELKPEAALTQERGKTHGRFCDHASYTQSLKRVMYRAEAERRARKQVPLNDMQRESLEMVFHKVGRILAGEADFQDHWDDIAGYAHLPGKEW